ncbi:MAG: CsbD family protein [Allosphingosinicella sp.]
MGEFTDKLKGQANQAIGGVKQQSPDPEVRDEGDAQKLKGTGQEIKGAVKGVVNDL